MYKFILQDIAERLLTNQLGRACQSFNMAQTGQCSIIHDILVHFMLVMTCVDRQPQLQMLQQLISQPQAMQARSCSFFLFGGGGGCFVGSSQN